MCDRLDHLGAGHEHVGAVLDHEDEVGDGRRIHRTARAGAHDHADLRHHAAGQHIALEHIGIAAKRRHALLDAGAARIVQADHRRADLHRLVHHLADLFGVRLGKRPAEHGEILAVDEHQPAVDHAVAGDHTVTRDLVVLHAEVHAAVFDKHVPLFEGAFVQQHFEALARGELALGVLGGNALFAAAKTRGGTLLFQLFKDVVHGSSFFGLMGYVLCS